MEKKKRTPKERWKRRLFIAAICIALFIPYSYWQNHAIVVSEYDFSSQEIPEAFEGYRILQISDLHNMEFGESQKHLIAAIEETKPDLIVITGDLIDCKSKSDEHLESVDAVMPAIEAMTALAPVYYVTGNHEQWSFASYDALAAQMTACGVHLLLDATETITQDDASITLVGLDNALQVYAGQRQLVSDAGTDFVMLLAHNPALLASYADTGADLVFCGHAHGGQIRLPLLGGLYAPDQGIFPAYTSGMYTFDKTKMVVSRGLGNSAFPFRIGNRPELIIVTLHAQA